MPARAPALPQAEAWRLSPAGFARKVHDLTWPPHLRLVSFVLVLVATGRIRRLTVSMPPGHAKSTAIMRTFPAWYLDIWPNKKLVGASYGGSLAVGHGKAVRETIEQHPQLLRVRLKGDSTAADQWETTAGGMMVTAGIGGSITGRRANGGLCDDLHKGYDDAHSVASRESVWNFWTGDMRTRLLPAAWQVIVGTRWHEEDIIGRIHVADESHQWVKLRLPAIAEGDETIDDVLGPQVCERLRREGVALPEWNRKAGEALWPLNFDPDTGEIVPWFDEEELASIRRDILEYKWSALYQQRPSPPQGEMFPASMWDRADAVPPHVPLVRYWDLAATEGGGDETVGALLCRDDSGYVYVVDVVHGRWSDSGVEKVLKATAVSDAERYGRRRVRIAIEQEGGPIWDEEPVLMADGSYRRLRDVCVGDVVVSGAGVGRAVEAVHVQGERPCVELTMHSGRRLVAAREHPILTPTGWTAAADIVVGDTVGLVRASPDSSSTRTAEEFRLAGYFLGDGSCGPTGKGSVSSVAAICCLDPVELADLEHCVGSLGFRMRQMKNRKDWNLSGGVQPWLRGVDLAGRRSHEKRVPAWVFAAPNEMMVELLGAYFACDGTLSPSGSGKRVAEFYSVSRGLLEDVQRLLLRIGVGSTIRLKNGVYGGNRHVSWRLSIRESDDGFARFLERVPIRHSTKGDGLRALSTPRRRFDEVLLPDRVVAVADAGIRPCRCLTVAVDHSFAPQDIVVANSGGKAWAKRLVREVLAGFNAKAEGVSGDKETRARPLAAQQQAGNVRLVRRWDPDEGAFGPQLWFDPLIEQHRVFPNGKHDDIVDAVSGAFNELVGTGSRRVRTTTVARHQVRG